MPPPISFSRKPGASGYEPAPTKPKAPRMLAACVCFDAPPPTQLELYSRSSRQGNAQPEHRRNLSSASDLSDASTVLECSDPHLKEELGPLPLQEELGPFPATDSSSGEESVQIDLDQTCVPCPWRDAKAETDWWARRWAQSQTNLTTCCESLPSWPAEALPRPPVFRKMWRVCVYCDALFTTNSHGAEGAEATVRLAKEYPRACVAPGTCDDCLEDIVEVRSEPNRHDRDLKEGPKALARPEFDRKALDQKGHDKGLDQRGHEKGLDQEGLPAEQPTKPTRSRSRRKKKVSHSGPRSAPQDRFLLAVSSSNRFGPLRDRAV